MPLTAATIENFQPEHKPRKLFDSAGLYLLANPNGSRWWRFKYRFDGKEKLLSLGVYADVSLSDARDKRDEARNLIAKGIDPSIARRADKAYRSNTFEAIAREWMRSKPPSKSNQVLERFVFPIVGDVPIDKITAPDLLTALRRVESLGKHEAARRTRQKCGEVFRYAIATGRASHDVSADLRDALARPGSKPHATIRDPAKIGELLRAIDTYSAQPITAYALKLALLFFVRPGELRHATWKEINFDTLEWRIPVARMKTHQQHIVPLCDQAIELLWKLHALTGLSRYLFPAHTTLSKPMNDNTINIALRHLGYSKDEMTAQGFRSMASTCLSEQGWESALIKLQLAQADRSKHLSTRIRAQRLPERRKMMQEWADYLDGLRTGRTVD